MSKPKYPRTLGETEAQAVLRNLRISPRKLNLVAGLIRNRTASEAVATLTFSKRRIAQDVRKVLESAIANAENNHQLDVDRLIVTRAEVGKSVVMRRFHARGRGRSARIEKWFSHLKIVVAERSQEVETPKPARVRTETPSAPLRKATGRATPPRASTGGTATARGAA
jgi:large subunit ribosomal protein L22